MRPASFRVVVHSEQGRMDLSEALLNHCDEHDGCRHIPRTNRGTLIVIVSCIASVSWRCQIVQTGTGSITERCGRNERSTEAYRLEHTPVLLRSHDADRLPAAFYWQDQIELVVIKIVQKVGIEFSVLHEN